jgi:hypothetical protein
MIRDLQKRLERVEESLQAQIRGPITLCFIERIDQFKPVALAENERIVYDVYRIEPGGLVEWARERITSDPSDEGRSSESGHCLETL